MQFDHPHRPTLKRPVYLVRDSHTLAVIGVALQLRAGSAMVFRLKTSEDQQLRACVATLQKRTVASEIDASIIRPASKYLAVLLTKKTMLLLLRPPVKSNMQHASTEMATLVLRCQQTTVLFQTKMSNTQPTALIALASTCFVGNPNCERATHRSHTAWSLLADYFHDDDAKKKEDEEATELSACAHYVHLAPSQIEQQ